MTHPPDNLLLSVATGVADRDQARDVGAHLERCAVCRARFESYREVESWLGEWAVSPGERDITEVVRARIDAGARRSPEPLRIWRLTRYAAAVLIGVGAGYAGESAMRLSVDASRPPAGEAVDVDPGSAADLLARPSATGLWLTFEALGSDDAQTEGGV